MKIIAIPLQCYSTRVIDAATRAVRHCTPPASPSSLALTNPIPGYLLNGELKLYVQDGFTPLEALQSATMEAAKALSVPNESDFLEPGRADVLLLDAYPLADIHNTRKVRRTAVDERRLQALSAKRRRPKVSAALLFPISYCTAFG